MSIDDEILACEAELRHAQLSGDVAGLDRLLDDLLMFTNIDGTLAQYTRIRHQRPGGWRLVAGHTSNSARRGRLTPRYLGT